MSHSQFEQPEQAEQKEYSDDYGRKMGYEDCQSMPLTQNTTPKHPNNKSYMEGWNYSLGWWWKMGYDDGISAERAADKSGDNIPPRYPNLKPFREGWAQGWILIRRYFD